MPKQAETTLLQVQAAYERAGYRSHVQAREAIYKHVLQCKPTSTQVPKCLLALPTKLLQAMEIQRQYTGTEQFVHWLENILLGTGYYDVQACGDKEGAPTKSQDEQEEAR